ncbi:MAG: hypothetical protein KIT31_07075 [Deltaproteobacteria bacterium]|nr:hypothetical protein [Deltaproteobacteria bacterium]
MDIVDTFERAGNKVPHSELVLVDHRRTGEVCGDRAVEIAQLVRRRRERLLLAANPRVITGRIIAPSPSAIRPTTRLGLACAALAVSAGIRASARTSL